MILEMMPSQQNLLLTGKHGIGKSEILTKYYEERGMKVVALFLGQMSDSGDLIGLPHKNEVTGKTDFMPPYWFPVDGKPIVLFLDELNRARPEVLQTIMDLALNRKLAGRELPEGSVLISAVNEGDEYQLTDLDPALVSRFNIVNFKPSVEEWLVWAEKQGLDTRVIQFISNNNIYLDGDTTHRAGSDTGLDKTPDRRAWEKVSQAILGCGELMSIHKKLIGAMVGANAANEFFKFAASKHMVGAKEVLANFSKAKPAIEKYELHQMALVNEAIFRTLEGSISKLDDKKKQTVAKNLQDYVLWLSQTNRKEVLANFTSIFEKQTYPNALGFILTKAPAIYNLLTQFVEEL